MVLQVVYYPERVRNKGSRTRFNTDFFLIGRGTRGGHNLLSNQGNIGEMIREVLTMQQPMGRIHLKTSNGT